MCKGVCARCVASAPLEDESIPKPQSKGVPPGLFLSAGGIPVSVESIEQIKKMKDNSIKLFN